MHIKIEGPMKIPLWVGVFAMVTASLLAIGSLIVGVADDPEQVGRIHRIFESGILLVILAGVWGREPPAAIHTRGLLRWDEEETGS